MSHLILGITPQKRNKSRVNLMAEEGFLLSISYETLLRHHIKEGSVVEEELLEVLRREDSEKYAKELAMGYIAYAPRTCRQVCEHLAAKGIDEQSVRAAIEALKRYGYVDDAAYIREFVRSYSGKLGKGAMRARLLQRGVSREDLDAHLELPEEDERAAAAAVLAKLEQRYQGQDEQKARQKVYAALARRGFSHEVISFVMKGEELD